MWWGHQKLPLNEKNQELWVPPLKLLWTGTMAEGWGIKDEGWRCCTPMQSLPESSNGIASLLHRKAHFKLAILLCWYLFVDHWTCVLCHGNLASCVWGKHLRVMGELKGKQTQPQWCPERDRSCPQWQEGPWGHRGWRGLGKQEGTEFQREAFEMIWVTSNFEKLYRKNVYSQWWTFFNFPINNK